MNDEKKIAQAILDACKMREDSFVRISLDGYGDYQLEMAECLVVCCKRYRLSSNLWILLNLAMHWYNDVEQWAFHVLEGKNILVESQENLIIDKVRKYLDLQKQ